MESFQVAHYVQRQGQSVQNQFIKLLSSLMTQIYDLNSLALFRVTVQFCFGGLLSDTIKKQLYILYIVHIKFICYLFSSYQKILKCITLHRISTSTAGLDINTRQPGEFQRWQVTLPPLAQG